MGCMSFLLIVDILRHLKTCFYAILVCESEVKNYLCILSRYFSSSYIYHQLSHTYICHIYAKNPVDREGGMSDCFCGEMGIGNTTTSSAVASVLLGKKAEEVTGRGAGLSSEGLQRKIRVIRQALEKNRPDPGDVLDVVAKVGGYDIAGMCGLFLGGAIYRIPVLIDGFISSVAALCAVRLAPLVGKYLFASHCSKEPGGKMVLDALGMSAMIGCDLSLGEGSGAVAAVPLLEMGLDVYRKMSTFEEIQVEQYQELK